MKKGWLKAGKFAAMLLVLALIARSLAHSWATASALTLRVFHVSMQTSTTAAEGRTPEG